MVRKIILHIIFLICSFASFSQTTGLDKWRKNYRICNNDSSLCRKMYELITKENSKDNTLICYRGAITAAYSKYEKNKMEKLKLFKEGKNLIESAISKDSTNLELIFLRFTVQTNCPKVLGYNKQIASDKKKILSTYAAVINTPVGKMIYDFSVHSAIFTEEEKQKIHP